ncbi:peptidase M28, partial [Chloroflexota bacterium]
VTGQESQGERPYRAGDYSFNNLGISGLFMLLSEMSVEKRRELGYYAVGGCGGNIGWHTEDDRLEIADRHNLERDIKIYAAAVARLVNSAIYPLDFRRVAEAQELTLQHYQKVGQGHVDLRACLEEVAALAESLSRFYSRLEELSHSSRTDLQVQRINEVLLRLARVLVRIDFARAGAFQQDPALIVEPLPDLAFIRHLRASSPDGSTYRFCQTQLTRGQNRVIAAFRQARWLAEQW